MMTSGYDASLPSSNYPHFEPRRMSGNIPASYDRPVPGPARQRSLSPGPSRRPYDGYLPHRTDGVQHRNTYRPAGYRPEPAGGYYYDRSTSPDPYGPPRPVDLVSRDRDPTWRFTSKPYEIPERRPLPPSPSRRFEPSDSWKQSHVDHQGTERSPHRHLNRHSRGSIDSSPERAGRLDRPPFIPGGDRYRPTPPKREIYPPPGRLDYDFYRPSYPPDYRYPEALSSPSQYSGQMPRRDSGPSANPRVYERPDLPLPIPKRSSGSSVPLAIPTPSSAWPDTSPPWSSPSLLEAPSREPPTRQGSRSSIASTHVSDRRSPGIASIPQPSPSIPLPAHLPAKPQAAIDALLRKHEHARPDFRSGPLGVDHHYPKPVNVQNELSQKATKPMDDGVRKSPNELTSEAIKPAAAVQDTPPKPSEPTIIATEGTTLSPTTNDIQKSIPAEPLSSSPPPSPPSAPDHPALEIRQDTPTPPDNHSSSDEEDDICAINIPPPVHSPSHSPAPSNADAHELDPILALSTLPRPNEIPELESAKTKEEALRIVVMTRLLRDHQSREARIEPVLFTNRSIAPEVEVHPFATPESLVDKMFKGAVLEEREVSAARTRPLLIKYFQDRQLKVDQKLHKLKNEYVTLQERWVAHCNSLNDQQKTLATEQESQPPMRTTRRSMAITDAVRSDFEMEQIIASLGNDDATDPNHLSIRNLAKVPDMISAVDGQVFAVFDDNNYLVENPAEYYSSDTGMHDWTDAEKQTFLEKFGAFPKQFGIIADFLPNKTAAQCVAYYYLHKKVFIDFRKIITQYAPNKRRRRGMGRKRGGGLLADIAMHDMEVHRGSGTASPASAAPARATRGRRSLTASAAAAAAKPSPASRRNAVQFEDTPGSTPTPEPEAGVRTTRRRKVAASSISSAISFAAEGLTVSSSISESISAPTAFQVSTSNSTTIVEDDDLPFPELRPAKRAKRTRKIKSAATVLDEPGSPSSHATPLAASEADVGLHSKKKDKAANSVHWTDEEKQLFLYLLSSYGNNFKRIAASMPGKTTLQVTNYYKTHQVEMNLADIAAKAAQRSPSPGSQWVDLHPPNSKPLSHTGFRSSSSSNLNVYPGSVSGATPYIQVSPREGQTRKLSWTGPPLPTRVPQRLTSGSDLHSPDSRRYGQNGGPHDYPYPPRTPHSPPTPRISHSTPGLASNISAISRPRISTSLGGSSPPIPDTSSPSRDASASAPHSPPPSGATAIVHSPTIPSPKLPAHQSPPPPQPHAHTPFPANHHPRRDQRPEQGLRFPHTHSPVNHQPQPRAGSTPSPGAGWRPGPGPIYGPRPYPQTNVTPPPGGSYRDARGSWIAGPEMVDPRMDASYWHYGRHPDDSPVGMRSGHPSHMARGPPTGYPPEDPRRSGPPEVGWPAEPTRRAWYS
ncbi:hypothetical protein CPB83DRAFT_190051 [Crepidotus variabilis]|uniref:SANT domain-containing protein n=1 Tax=Crepidotus variabilis TaxID=179855 RepID=A0A9P6JRU1_9AGAR|nr:hypothetical protein CPB83DRAFT_190051 [Crepidotus variabilis]